ncbi:MAG: hypothetical protein KC561_15370, partial [Myxococcales bacterium]|nr:hypothetical protein [Myxococcales bacterium]
SDASEVIEPPGWEQVLAVDLDYTGIATDGRYLFVTGLSNDAAVLWGVDPQGDGQPVCLSRSLIWPTGVTYAYNRVWVSDAVRGVVSYDFDGLLGNCNCGAGPACVEETVGISRMAGAADIASDDSGRVYVLGTWEANPSADTPRLVDYSAVWRFTPDQTVDDRPLIYGSQLGASSPLALDVGPTGTQLYVVDAEGGLFALFYNTVQGVWLTPSRVDSGLPGYPGGVALTEDGADLLWTTQSPFASPMYESSHAGQLQRVSVSAVGRTRESLQGSLLNPTGVVDLAGSWCVTDRTNGVFCYR